MNIAQFQKKPIMGILRGITEEALKPLMEAIISSGMETIEITMNTPDACRLIQKTVKYYGKALTVGAGTVLSKSDAEKARDSGATFMVSPTCVSEVNRYCRENNIPFFPGALTPQEIYACWQEGAAMVKVFPSKFFGPEYFKEIKGPFQDIKLLACGGVTPGNIISYLKNGADGIAVGSSIFKKEWIENKEFSSVEKAIKNLLTELH